MAFHTNVKLAKYDFKDFQLTVNLAAGITSADVGKALAQDLSADNTLKLAGNGEEIVAILYTVEDRVNEGQLVGTAEFKFAAKLPIKSGLTGAQVVARGSRLIGAGAGEVRALDVATDTTPYGEYATAPTVYGVTGLIATALKL
jgi:hypothetical protein